MTASECAGRATDTLVAAGALRDEATRDAAVLLRHLLGWDLAEWWTRRHEPVAAGVVSTLDGLVSRRAAREPVAYLTGIREFYGRTFAVTRDVLIPRPETELLVERALAVIDRSPAPQLSIVDVGTGSGCIAVTLAAERASLHVVGTDTSRAALAVASGNAQRVGVAPRVSLREGSLTDGLRGVDLIVSNPPYIGESERAGLMPDVRDYEPGVALFAGRDGLDTIGRLVPEAAGALRPGGTLLLEVGTGQSEAVHQLLSAAGFHGLQVHHDLAGHARVVEGRLPVASV